MWRTNVDEPKTVESGASIPVLTIVRDVLEKPRAKVQPQPDHYIFAGERRGAPLNLANLANRVIKPALAKLTEEREELLK